MKPRAEVEAVLVTGGAGFIGSHVARHLLAAGYRVVVCDDLSGGAIENVPEGADFRKGSVTDAEFVSSLFDEHQFVAVFHLAAYAAEGLSHFIRRFNYTNNVIGSVNLINAAVSGGVRLFVFTSSIAVYGHGASPVDESMQPHPVDPYGIAKYAVELDLAAARELFGLDYVIFRPHNVYGEGQNIGDPYRNVIGIFMNQIMSGRPMSVFGDGLQRRAFTHVSNVAPVIARSLEVPGAWNTAYNIGADRSYSVVDLTHAVRDAMAVPDAVVVHLPARNEVGEIWADHARVREAFGVGEDDITLEDGLRAMASWAKRVGPRKGEAFGHIELERGLPESWRRLVGERP